MRLLKTRSNQKELMDDLELADKELELVLKELRIINRYLGGNALTTQGIGELINKYFEQDHEAGNRQSKALRIADLGCGGGDMLITMAKWARKRKIKASFIGIDANSYIIAYAKKKCKNFTEISFKTVNVFDKDFTAETFDIITCTLFTHHFTDKQLVKMLSEIKPANLGWVINDLHRHWLAYYLIKGLTTLFSSSFMVKNDAPLSVARAFRRNDWINILKTSNIRKFKLNWKWAFRWKLIIYSKKIK